MPVNSVTDNSILSQFSTETRFAPPETEEANELGQDQFLQLLITQLNNQDPLNPQENGEFIAQLAQFSQVESLEQLNTSFDSFASGLRSSQALQASSLVGRSVLIDSNTAELTSEGLAGTVAVPQSTSNVTVDILSFTGELVGQVQLGPQVQGDAAFEFDGIGLNGEPLPFGNYVISASATIAGQPQQLQTALPANVDSVSIGAAGEVTLNVAGVGPIPIEEVRQIQ